MRRIRRDDGCLAGGRVPAGTTASFAGPRIRRAHGCLARGRASAGPAAALRGPHTSRCPPCLTNGLALRQAQTGVKLFAIFFIATAEKSRPSARFNDIK
ncbi:hypothetical protein GCM10027018_12780 [Paenibacillus thermoaerophilus]